ncbi:hypothetical protein OIU79_017301 [Salix purpurea]|uniref:Uncharacterized protein n=1 Tax=Salix purpurea TaxID=77065 RepID=A0A9Q1AJW9_SALPP|nr:hypothetical protein OIU79_017301 [Salix purpurea]
MASGKPSHIDCSALLVSTFKKAQKRWRIAYLTIRSVRAMLSLVRDIVSETNSHQFSGLLNSVSYAVLDTEPSSSRHRRKENESTISNPDIDQTKLTEMVKQKDQLAA